MMRIICCMICSFLTLCFGNCFAEFLAVNGFPGCSALVALISLFIGFGFIVHIFK